MLGRFLKYWLPLFLWMAVIFGASTGLGAPNHTSRFVRPLLLWLKPDMSEETIAKIHYGVRKTAHAVEYGILGLLMWRAFGCVAAFQAASITKQAMMIVLLCAFYAGTDELHQIFVKGRESSVWDVILDTAGSCVGAIVFNFNEALRRRQRLARQCH